MRYSKIGGREGIRTLGLLVANDVYPKRANNAAKRNATIRVSLVAALITGTADELMAREAIRLTARPQALFPGHAGGLALQYLVQFPPPMEQTAFHRLDRKAHQSSGLSRG